MDRLKEAQAKIDLGVPRHIVLSELGYEEIVPEIAAKPALQDAAAM
jgi:hypothetical protein